MAAWRRRGAAHNAYNNIDYQPVRARNFYYGNDDDDEEDDNEEVDEALLETQFSQPPAKIPWSALVLATILCIGGGTLLSLGFLLMIGYLDPQYVDRTWPLLVLGFVMFVPGVYHVRIAYFAFLNRPGYSFEDIPAFDD